MWSLSIAFVAMVSSGAAFPLKRANTPTVALKNGTYTGTHSSVYNQDFFLGIPYAKPPVGDLRFRVPQSLNTTWSGTRPAQAYSPECYGYSSDQWNYQVSEDCLYLNVVRPAGYDNASLPVAFWIHGGGFTAGGGVDQRYNTSFTIQNSVTIGKPIITVSINYRLSTWGFLNSKEVVRTGNTNVGLRDQRLALHWVKENIAAFGGNPDKITIWGESAGAASVGFHLTAYGGRDDKLFVGAIMESGNPAWSERKGATARYQALYDLISARSGCANSTDSLQCLRGVSATKFNGVINGTATTNSSRLTGFGPSIDGDFIQSDVAKQLPKGEFVHVPIISGANSDEGFDFSPRGINTTEDFYNAITSPGATDSVPPKIANALLEAYPDDPAVNIGASLGPTFRFGPPFGAQFRRAASYYGDATFIAARRFTCQTWAHANVSAYCYRFNAVPAGVSPISAVTHFQEIAFVFFNTLGIGYPPVAINPFTNKGEAYTSLSKFMNSNWVSFVHDQDPNAWRSKWNGSEALWPKYSVAQPKDYVFDANVTSHAEDDTFRAEGINLINSRSTWEIG